MHYDKNPIKHYKSKQQILNLFWNLQQTNSTEHLPYSA